MKTGLEPPDEALTMFCPSPTCRWTTVPAIGAITRVSALTPRMSAVLSSRSIFLI